MHNFRDCSQPLMTREPVHHPFPCAATNIHMCNKFKRLRIFPSCHALFPYTPLLFITTSSMRKTIFLPCSPRRSLRTCWFVNPSEAGRGETLHPAHHHWKHPSFHGEDTLHVSSPPRRKAEKQARMQEPEAGFTWLILVRWPLTGALCAAWVCIGSFSLWNALSTVTDRFCFLVSIFFHRFHFFKFRGLFLQLKPMAHFILFRFKYFVTWKFLFYFRLKHKWKDRLC